MLWKKKQDSNNGVYILEHSEIKRQKYCKGDSVIK